MDWLKAEILTGVQRLLCLGLEGQPAAEVIPGTVGAWCEALESSRAWCPQRDPPRIRTAFTALLRTRTRWPTPADFLTALPTVNPGPSLPARIFSDEEIEANKRRLADMIATVFPDVPAEHGGA